MRLRGEAPSEAQTFSDLDAFFEENDPQSGWVFRGQADASWPLTPALARGPIQLEWEELLQVLALHIQRFEQARAAGVGRNDDRFDASFRQGPIRYAYVLDLLKRRQASIEQTVLRAFKHHAAPLLQRSPENDWEWLAIGRHHGLHTRLLDFSLNPLAACYFAVSSEPAVAGSVVAVKVDRTLPEGEPLSDLSETARWVPRALSDRIARQASVFIVPPIPIRDLRPTADDHFAAFAEITIPAKAKPLIERKLENFGVNFFSLRRDLDGAATHINWTVSNPQYLASLRDGRGEMLGNLAGLANELRNFNKDLEDAMTRVSRGSKSTGR